MNDYRQIIEDSVLSAENELTKLPNTTFLISGYSSKKVRILLNSVVEKTKGAYYLEVGSWRGSTLVSALYGNEVVRAYAIDNWSEFDDGTAKSEFMRNTEFHIPGKFKLIEGDCFSPDVIRSIEPGVNVFFFDGNHEYQSHYDALAKYIDRMSNDFIFIVDDFDPYNEKWAEVERGTRKSIADLGLIVVHEVHLKSSGRNSETSWWNGIYVAHIKKNDGKA